MDLNNVWTSYKVSILKNYGWSLREIDETDFSNLISFVAYLKESNNQSNPGEKKINGEVYELSQEPPPWF